MTKKSFEFTKYSGMNSMPSYYQYVDDEHTATLDCWCDPEVDAQPSGYNHVNHRNILRFVIVH